MRSAQVWDLCVMWCWTWRPCRLHVRPSYARRIRADVSRVQRLLQQEWLCELRIWSVLECRPTMNTRRLDDEWWMMNDEWWMMNDDDTKKKQNSVFFSWYFDSHVIFIKLKCFFSFGLNVWLLIRYIWILVLLPESMLANFVGLLVSFGLWILSVLLFADFSSFTGVVQAAFLLMPSPLIFVLLFVSVSSLLCVIPTAILTLLKTISRSFVLVGFVFLLSELFFWSFKSVRFTPRWSAVPRLPMIPCVLMVSCLGWRMMRSIVKSRNFTFRIPAVICAAFLPFRVLVLAPRWGVASTVARGWRTRSTGIGFPSVSVSVMKGVRMRFWFVLPVLMKWLMTRRSCVVMPLELR